jgi:type IV pilus assembly protein PilF
VRVSQVFDFIKFYLLAVALGGCAVQPLAPENTPTQSTTSDTDESARGRARIHTELAASYLEVRNLGVALEEAGIAQRSDPGYGPAYNVAALIYIELKDDRMADENFRQALRINPRDADAHNNYGTFLCDRKRESEGIQHFLQAIRDPLYQNPDRSFYNAGICARRRGDARDAENYFRNAVKLQPNQTQALYQLAELSYASGRYSEARSFLARLAPVASGSAEVLWLMLRTERRLGDSNAVDSLSYQLRTNFPNSKEAELLAAGRFD